LIVTMAPGRIPFLLGQATPHAVRLAGPQGKGQAFPPHRAPGTDLFGPRYLLDGRRVLHHQAARA
jgi:hypothetical protein